MRAGAVSVLAAAAAGVLVAVFAVAGLAKLADPNGSREAASAFGVPHRLCRGVAVALPLVELATALLLVPTATRWFGGLAALFLLLAFCCAIGAALARGARPECHCFGRLRRAPVGWRTLARNGALVALALVVVAAGRARPGPDALSWCSRLDVRDWVTVALAGSLLATVGLGGLVLAHALRGYGRVLVRLERLEWRLRAAGFELGDPDDVPRLGLPPGAEAPAFSLDSLDGGRVGLDTLLEPGRPLLLLFTSPTCGPCSLLLPTVSDWQREHAEELTIALLGHGDEAAIRAEAAAHAVELVLLDRDGSVSAAYEANGTPSAVLVGADGSVASWLAAGSDWIQSLVEQTIHAAGAAGGLPIGSELPATPVATLDGAETVLASVVAEPTALLFWSPGCGYCRSLHEDLLAWESDRRVGSPALVVVSAGDPDDVRAEGFTRVVLDPDWSASSALGVDGTPMALLVDADGRIASPVVAGGPAVLALLGAGTLSTA